MAFPLKTSSTNGMTRTRHGGSAVPGSRREAGFGLRAWGPWGVLAAVAMALMVSASPARAWSLHALAARPALEVLPELQQARPVAVESLEAFLAAEGPALEALLADEEAWARAQVPSYPPRPDALAFRAAGADPQALRQRFLAAVRVNPQSRLALFLQRLPGQDDGGREPLNWSKVTTLRSASVQIAARYVALREGETVAPIDVLVSACDEPDFGLDLGLFEDNGTAYGARYGFGRQPFGNAAYEYSSQAPLHMGYYHEAAIVYRAAGFLKRTWPEYRVHLWQRLARHALATGHGYWGWRFAGWALHYLQDLTQPYHARVLPGIGVTRMLWINGVDLAGWHRPKEEAITLVANRHTAIENYQYFTLMQAHRRGLAHPALAALRDRSQDRPAGPGAPTGTGAAPVTTSATSAATASAAMPAWTDTTLRAGVAREAAEAADALDETLEASLPPRYIADPGYATGVTEPGLDLAAVVAQGPAAARQRLDAMMARLLSRFGVHTRAFVLDLLARPGAR